MFKGKIGENGEIGEAGFPISTISPTSPTSPTSPIFPVFPIHNYDFNPKINNIFIQIFRIDTVFDEQHLIFD